MFEFIDITNNKINIDKRNTAFSQFRRIFGKVPPHLELVGNINPELLSDFLKYNMGLLKNKKFHRDYFIFIRLHTALKQNYEYCIDFNSSLLMEAGYDKYLIEKLDDIDNFPVDDSLKLLAKKSYKAIFDSVEFGETDLQELYDSGWEIAEIYQVIDHIGLLEKNRRIIKAFLKSTG